MSTFAMYTKILAGLFFGILIFVGLIGNLVVCLAVYKTKKLRKKRYCYFVSLAGADLVLCLFVMPFAAVYDISERWLFGPIYCHLWLGLDVACCTASILHLCAVSVDRYFFVHDPLRYREKNTLPRLIVVIIGIWLGSLAVAASALGMPSSDLTKNITIDNLRPNDTELRSDYCGFNLDPIYAVILSSISFFIPCFIMIMTYRKLYVYARQHSRMIGYQLKAAAEFLLSVALQRQQKSSSELKEGAEGRIKKRQFRLTLVLRRLSKKRRRRAKGVSIRKARVTLGVTMGMFIFSWLGYFVCNVVRSFWPDLVPHWLFVALTWMGYANSAQNPIIYSIFNKDFRLAFAKILSLNIKKKGKTSETYVGRNEEEKDMEINRGDLKRPASIE